MVFKSFARYFSTTTPVNVKVAVVGASGGIGSPLSLLLKLSPLVTELSLYDVKNAHGVATDLSHIDRNSKTNGGSGEESLKCILEGQEVVVISAGLPRKPGMTRDDLFNSNASIVEKIMEAIAQCCPSALIGIITNPVNSVVPIAAEVMKNRGTFYPGRLFGISTLDVVRASTFLGNCKGIDPQKVSLPVIGGHSGITIVPLISRAEPKMMLKDDEIVALTKRIQNAGTEVVNAKGGTGSATLSMAYAAARFTSSLCRALGGEENIVECAYVYSDLTEAKYFSSPVVLGKCGVRTILPLPMMSKYENSLLKEAVQQLKINIEKGEKFINKS